MRIGRGGLELLGSRGWVKVGVDGLTGVATSGRAAAACGASAGMEATSMWRRAQQAREDGRGWGCSSIGQMAACFLFCCAFVPRLCRIDETWKRLWYFQQVGWRNCDRVQVK